MTRTMMHRPNRSQPIIVILLLTVACLAPFLDKAFHIDDTLFLWVARHIHEAPLDFYGFDANWYGETMRMSDINQNPPLVSYWIALVTAVFGEREIFLHLAFLLPAFLVIWGTWELADRWSRRPLTAALAVLFTPAFLVSSTTVMSDTPMVAAYVWSLVFWMRGMERDGDGGGSCLASALLMAVAALTKYFGITAAALALVYTLVERRNPARLFWLLVPAAILGLYQWYTKGLYGHGLFSNAAAYAVNFYERDLHQVATKTLIGLAFTGGCLAVAFFTAPLLWTRPRSLGIGALVVLPLLGALAVLLGKVGPMPIQTPDGLAFSSLAQLVAMAGTGLLVLLLAWLDLWRRRDGAAVLLFCWILGTFVFATYLNWTTNARTILPMAPALGILLARRLELAARRRPTVKRLLPGSLTLAAILALAVAAADTSLADAQRRAAQEIMSAYQGKRVWFQGHWGFQYYMERLGGRALDFTASRLRPGELLVIPGNNTNTRKPAIGFGLVRRHAVQPLGWLTTMGAPRAGFYADIWGPLPYAFGPVKPEEFFVLRFLPPASAVGRRPTPTR